ncbi:MAG: LacI family transcriptional regulator [Clostridiales bacterium]|jgi:LacI family transcriptional regulator|nr:LacI family transcriptional regulator [Clostridiales bacterium]
MSKVTMQMIADAAGVSRITVWKVFNNRPGVSNAVIGRVNSLAESMGYETPNRLPPSTAGWTFSVVVSRPDSAMFWMQIIHNAAKELARNGINLLYTYMPSNWYKDYQLPAVLTDGTVEALLILNIYDPKLHRMLADLPLPKVFFDSVPPGNNEPLKVPSSDITLLEGRAAMYSITSAILAGTPEPVGFIGDIRYALTNLDRWQGFQDAFAFHGRKVDPALCLTGPIGLQTHEKEIYGFLDGLQEFPRAIVCASDFIADFVQRYMNAAKRAVPEGFILTGFDNSQEYYSVAGRITTVEVQTASLGQALSHKLMFRALYPAAPNEVTYIGTKVIWRDGLEPEKEA